MRIVAIIIAALLLPAISFAAAPNPNVVIDHKAFAEDRRVALTLKSIADSHQFDEAAARRLMPLLLIDGLVPEEQDLYYELIMARSPVEVRSPFGTPLQVPPPDGNARAYMSLLKLVVESPNLDATLDARWLTDSEGMRELVDISTLGTSLETIIGNYMARKFGQSWIKTGPQGGAIALRGDLAKLRMLLGQTDVDTERRGKTLAYNAIRQLDNVVKDAIPDEMYADLKP